MSIASFVDSYNADPKHMYELTAESEYRYSATLKHQPRNQREYNQALIEYITLI